MTRKTATRPTIGATISTLAFAGCSLWLMAEAAVSPPLQSWMLALCAASCLAAAFRKQIAQVLAMWSQRSKHRDDTGSARDPS